VSPNISRYPEIDFAAKLTMDNSWLARLGNSTNRAVGRQIQGKVLFVGAAETDKGVDRVVVGTVPTLKPLRFGQSYL